MLESCLDPALAAELTCQPVRRHGVDAAVFFSDIMVPLKLAGVDVEIALGVGPVMGAPTRTDAEIAQLCGRGSGDQSVITDGVALTVRELGDTTPVLGFAGAPFTLAAYLVEGRPSRDHLAARTLMHANPAGWQRLANWCADVSVAFMKAQVAGGARAFQLFDSWAGSLSRADYAKYCAPSSRKVLRAAHDLGIPTIHFGVGTGCMLDLFSEDATAVGVDYRTDLRTAISVLRSVHSEPVIVQGNIDPAMLGCPPEVLEAHINTVITAGRNADAHILNLGHGVPKDTDPDVLTRLVARVHERTAND